MRRGAFIRIGSLVAALLIAGACQAAPAQSPTTATLSATPSAPVGSPAPELDGPPPFVLPRPAWQVACQGIDPESCQRMALDASVSQRPGEPPIRTVLIRCATPPCTPAEGNGETILIYADGTSEASGSWGHSTALPGGTPGAPPAAPAGDWELVCEGIARSQCEEFAADSFAAIDSSDLELHTLTLTCLSESCTTQAGRVRAVARFVDGSEQSVGEWEYVGSKP